MLGNLGLGRLGLVNLRSHPGPSGPPNLLGVTPAWDWPNPERGRVPGIAMRTHADGSASRLTTLIAGITRPGSQADWSVPRGYAYPVALRTHHDGAAGRLNALVGGIVQPFSMTEWPNPLRRGAMNYDASQQIGLIDTTPVVAPFVQADWPNPGRRSALVASAGPGSRAILAGGAAAATWNNSDRDTNITLSNSFRTATATATADTCVRDTISHSSGTYYSEHAITTLTSNGVLGVANSTQSKTALLGLSANGVGWIFDGRVYLNSSQIATVTTVGAGQTGCVAVDFDHMKIWFRTNGGNWNNDVIGNQNPATNTGGISISGLNAGPYFMMLDLQNNNDAVTSNFATGDFAFTPPSGFVAW